MTDGAEGSGLASPRVSVIVPARNAAGSLRRLFAGLASQTCRDFEVILIDDGSTDDTREVTQTACRDGLAIRYVRQEGVGAVKARCAGIEVASGEILAFTDSDCVPEPAWLAEGVTAIDAGADLVQGCTKPERSVGPLERSLSYSGGEGLFATCNVFYRRSSFDAVGGFDRVAGTRLGFRRSDRARGLGFGEDTLLGWAVARSGRSVCVPEAVVRHEVVRPPVAETVSRAWQTGAFPRLVRDVPELRRTLLDHAIFLGAGPRLVVYGIAAGLAAAVAGAPRAAAFGATGAMGAVWIGARARRALGVGGPKRLRAAALAVELAIDVVVCAALVVGSLRARRVVL